VAGQPWLADMFAGVMLVTAAYCLARLVISGRQHRRTDRPVDALHVLMGLAMAGMLVPRLRVFWAGGWEVIFGAATVWFGWLAVREYRHRAALGRFRPHHAQHVLASAAMVYMFAAVTTAATAASGSGMSGLGGGARFPTLALVFAVALFGYVVWTADRLPALAWVSALARASAHAPAVAAVAAVGAAVPAAAVPVAAVPVGGPGSAAAGPPDGYPALAEGCPAPADGFPALADGCPAPAGTGSAWSGPPLSPRLAACVEIVMGVTMGYALILML
jgi:Domain of unknown function (DUF5134)